VQRARGLWVIYVSLAIAMTTMLLPLQLEWRFLRPDIVALTLFYWALALPHRVGVATAFTVGLAQDLIEGAPLGLSSLGLMIATLLLLLNYQRIRQFDVLQQSLMMLFLMMLSSAIEMWLRNAINFPVQSWSVMLGLVFSVMLWVPLRHLLRSVRRYYEVY